jgi:hypothetical protein
MKITLNVPQEFEIKTLLIDAEVRYWEDSIVDGINDDGGHLIPCRNGNRWQPIIDIKTGRIINWEKGKAAEIYYQVCDDGEYWLQDASGKKIVQARGYYVPNFLSADDEDYIEFTVDGDGFIQGWRFDPAPFVGGDDD